MWKERLQSFSFWSYDETRNTPSIDWSSKLSPYLRFGLLSPREIYQTAKSLWASTYISELAWREFWQHIFYHFPHSREVEFQEKRRNIAWKNTPEHLDARKNGLTGYPFVDAWMRQLKAENRMHNRVRMVVASFLTKDLLIDRRLWEKHFASLLIDYDTNVNIWNRQRAASVWADPKPLRIFSPMLQSERFDPQCTYIKNRIPELSDMEPEKIHAPLEYDLWYAKPIVDHYERTKLAKIAYKDSSEKTTI
jgi:deoxyribodipyrimidine photo-lyase